MLDAPASTSILAAPIAHLVLSGVWSAVAMGVRPSCSSGEGSPSLVVPFIRGPFKVTP